MLRLLVDTSVWLDIAKDYRQRPTITALEQLVRVGEVSLVMPRIVLDEFARNKERIAQESSKSLSSVFRRVREAVTQFGNEEGRERALAELSDVDHRIATLGEAVNESIGRLEKLFAGGDVVETDDSALARAARRAVDKRAPFHKSKNSMADAILIEIYADLAESTGGDSMAAFVTHNVHDFSHYGVDNRQPHPDIADAFLGDSSIYSTTLGELLNRIAPEWMEDIRFEFEYEQEPRKLSEILEAEHVLFRQVWYNRHWNLKIAIEEGKHRLVPKEKLSTNPYRSDETLDTVWTSALEAAKRTEEEVGLENLGPWTDFEWGMLNGKLSALRWVLGDDWDMLDT